MGQPTFSYDRPSDQTSMLSSVRGSCELITQISVVKQIEIASWAGGAYGIFARVGDVSEMERASAASE